MTAKGSTVLALATTTLCAAAAFGAPPKGSVATPGAKISTPKTTVSTARAVITAPKHSGSIVPRYVEPPDAHIGAAVGSRGGYCGGVGWTYSGWHGHRYRYDYPPRTTGLISPPMHTRETATWVSVPVAGSRGGVTHHAYYWHPAVVPPLAETARAVDPAMMGAPPTPRQLPSGEAGGSGEIGQGAYRVEDKALEAMRAKDYRRAALLYQQRWMEIVDQELGMDEGTRHAAERDLVLGALGQSHAEVLRLRAIALVGAGRHEHAVRELERAYRLEPTLEQRPVFGMDLVEDAYTLRRLVNSSVRYAHRSDDAAAWKLVAMLMRAEGREQLAAKMADRASAGAPDQSGEDYEEVDGEERPLSIFRD